MRRSIGQNSLRKSSRRRRHSTHFAHKCAGVRYPEQTTKGETSSQVTNARARLQAARAEPAAAEADLERQRGDTERLVALAQQGVASEQDRDRAEAALRASQAQVKNGTEQVAAAEADLNTAIARIGQASTATSAEPPPLHAVPKRDLAGIERRRVEALFAAADPLLLRDAGEHWLADMRRSRACSCTPERSRRNSRASRERRNWSRSSSGPRTASRERSAARQSIRRD